MNLNNQTEVVHRAIQLLVKSAKSWLPAKDDDSHTNIAWLKSEASFMARPFALGIIIKIELNSFELVVLQNELKEKITLASKKHEDIEQELLHILDKKGLSKNDWIGSLHYELPYSELEQYIYPEAANVDFKEFIKARTFGQIVFENYEAQNGIELGLRTWPHHFDLGGLYTTATKANGDAMASIGMGLAMEDSLINEYYFYITHWKEGGVKVYPELPQLKHKGEWYGDEPMAVLKLSGLDLDDKKSLEKAIEFIHHAVRESRQLLNS